MLSDSAPRDLRPMPMFSVDARRAVYKAESKGVKVRVEEGH